MRRPRGGQTVLHWVAAVITWALVAVQCVRRWRFVFSPSPTMGDFQVYLDGVHWLWAGHPLYDFRTTNDLGFTYPPFAALFFSPLAAMPDHVAQRVWTSINLVAVCALAMAIAQVWLRHRTPTVRWVAGGLIAVVFMESVIVQANLLFGQVSMFLALLSALETGRVLRSRRWGALTGFAAAIKLTPGLFGLLHLVADRRRFWWSFGCGAGATLLAAAILPRDSLVYWTNALWNTTSIGDVGAEGNVTWMGLATRLGLQGTPRSVVVLVLSVATVGVALWNGRRHFTIAPMAAAAIVGCASALVVPISWPHHTIWIVVWAAGAILTSRRWLQALGAGVLGLTVAWVPLAGLATRSGLGQVPYAALTLIVATAICLPCTARTTEPPASLEPTTDQPQS